tara:strand:- start:48 stop:563 length:516 start_codon:yes stop_codon:yes gene_type:complete
MAGSLVKVSSSTITSASANVILTGIDTDDVYMLTYRIKPVTDSATGLYLRFTESGTANSTSNYDYADNDLRANEASFGVDYATNQSLLSLAWATGNATGEEAGGIIYIYNANSSSTYTSLSYESYYMVSTPVFRGRQGTMTLTVDSAVDGVEMWWSTGNIAEGEFTLYKVV